MKLNSWLFPGSPAEARNSQLEMANLVILEDRFNTPITYIAGMDVSNNPFDPNQMVYAAAVILSYPTLTLLEISTVKEKQTFPYISGLLGFREAPALINAFEKLSQKPDVIFVDGHGVSHPRGLGIASHLGVLLNIPTIGVAKSVLVRKEKEPLGDEIGSQTPLIWQDKIIGTFLRTKKNCLPLIVSAGHRITLKTAVQLVKSCILKHRLVEPTRQAHLAANIVRTQM